jgi:hypothetical protein
MRETLALQALLTVSASGLAVFIENYADIRQITAKTGFAGLHPPPSSPPKLAVEDLPAERPIFGRFFAIVRAALASLRIGLVS